MSYPRVMKSTMLLLAVALTSVIAADPFKQLKLICDDKKVELTRASELAVLVDVAKSLSDGAVCSPRIRVALVELNNLISSNDKDVCSPIHIDRIRGFYYRFVDQKSINEQQEKKLPGALKDFFLNYGFGVSRVCKKNMISSLTDGRKMLDAADFEQISTFTSDKSPLAKIIKAPKDVDDIVLPREMEAFVLEKNRTDADDLSGHKVKTSFVLQSKAVHSVKKVQSLCANKFQPIYGQLVLPLVSLSRIGLNYKGDDMSSHVKDLKSNKEIHEWYRIVYLCELLRIVEVFEEPEEPKELEEPIEGGDKKVVRVLTSEEADQMRQRQPAGEILGDKLDYQVANGHQVGDLIVDKDDKSMRKLVSKFDDHKTEMRRLRSRIVSQTLALTKEFLKKNKVKFVGSLLKKGSVSSLNDRLEIVAGDYIRRLSEQENRPAEGHVIKKRQTNPMQIGIATIVGIAMITGFIYFMVHLFG